MEPTSERRLIENEATFRRANEHVVQGIAELDALAIEYGQREHSASPKLMGQQLHFYCECADTKCALRVKLTLGDYQAIHKDRDRFVVIPGHEVPAIEQVVARHEPEYIVVEKLTTVPY